MSDDSDAEQAPERLIQLAGSKNKAHALINAVKIRGDRRPGRELSYQYVDQRLFGNAVVLEALWRRLGVPPPTRMELIKRQVNACWRDEGTDRNGNRRGRWDEPICSSLLLGTVPPGMPPPDTAALGAALADAPARADTLAPDERVALEHATLPANFGIRDLLYDLGANPKAVLRRFRDLPELTLNLDDEGVVSGSFESPKGHGKGSFWKNSSHMFGARVAPETWLLLHLEHPEWRLLPADVKWGAFDDVAPPNNT
jgi:hypothetical protein